MISAVIPAPASTAGVGCAIHAPPALDLRLFLDSTIEQATFHLDKVADAVQLVVLTADGRFAIRERPAPASRLRD